MSTAITLANGENMGPLLSLMSRRATEATAEEDTDEAQLARQHAIKPLLEGGQEGAVWLVGPVRAPLGYVIVTFGWSVSAGGREAWVEDIFIRPSVRRRGIGTEVMHAISTTLSKSGLAAMHVRLSGGQAIAASFCARAGFAPQSDVIVMSDVLRPRAG